MNINWYTLEFHDCHLSNVGIHIRRTDYIFFDKKVFKKRPLKSDYFNDAMAYFKEEYENCVFVVASDDIGWAKVVYIGLAIIRLLFFKT